MQLSNPIASLSSILLLFTLNSCGGGGSYSDSTVLQISSFTAAQSWIKPNTSTELTAVFSHGTGVVDQGVGPVQSGVPFKLNPLTTSTIYSLSVTNGTKTISTTTTVTVSEFTLTGSLKSGRYLHTANLLSNGKVLVVGGYGDQAIATYGALSDAELYDPTTGSFSPGGVMNEARHSHTATTLQNGKILLVGGYGKDGKPVFSAELYDPTTALFTLTGSLGTTRSSHTATLLSNGKVLILGGQTIEAELYNPATGTFSPTEHIGYSRRQHTATYLPTNGKVLILGGWSEGYNIIGTPEIFDPLLETWGGPQQGMIIARYAHSATLLNDGMILIVGGRSFSNTDHRFELYYPDTGLFISNGSMGYERYYHTATLLPNGKVVVVGGINANGSPLGSYPGELYDPIAKQFSTNNIILHQPRAHHSATLLSNGRVLIVGGTAGAQSFTSAELY